MQNNISKHLKPSTRFLRTWHPGRKAIAIFCSTGAVLAVGGGIGGFALASSGSNTVTATTTVAAHPDTTNVSGGACNSVIEPSNGPVWAFDHFTATLTAVPTGAGTWGVTLQVVGGFNGFADPTTCAAALSSGSLLGLINYHVTSPVAPSASFVSASYPGSTGLSGIVKSFFDSPTSGFSITGTSDYFFVYQGGAYVQTTSNIYGDVTANDGAVTGLHVTAVTATVAKLAWNAKAGATGYAYKIVSPAGFSTQEVSSNAATLTGLKAHTKYTVIVSALPSVSGHGTLTFTTN